MTTKCQNCDSDLQGKYCINCGQISDTSRINIRFLWHDIQHGLSHFDKGILFTTKELFTRPGHTIRDFLNGKRVSHFKPISLVLVLAGIYGFLTHYFQINILANNIQVNGSGEKFEATKEIVSEFSEWISQHYSLLSLIQIPIFSIGTYFGFKKIGFNFTEHLVINAFLTGQRLILHIITFPLYYALNGTSTLRTTARIIDIIGYVLMAWTLFQLFNKLNKFERAWRIILSLFIALILTFIILTIVSKYLVSSVN